MGFKSSFLILVAVTLITACTTGDEPNQRIAADAGLTDRDAGEPDDDAGAAMNTDAGADADAGLDMNTDAGPGTVGLSITFLWEAASAELFLMREDDEGDFCFRPIEDANYFTVFSDSLAESCDTWLYEYCARTNCWEGSANSPQWDDDPALQSSGDPVIFYDADEFTARIEIENAPTGRYLLSGLMYNDISSSEFLLDVEAYTQLSAPADFNISTPTALPYNELVDLYIIDVAETGEVCVTIPETGLESCNE